MQYKIEGIKSANGMEVKRVYIIEKGNSVISQLGRKAVIGKEGRKATSRSKANLHSLPCIGRSEVNISSNLPVPPLKIY